jgi:nitronate monooxygenase
MSLDQGRAEGFCKRLGLKLPILLAPMAGVSPPSLSIAMMNAGSLGRLRRAVDAAERDHCLG